MRRVVMLLGAAICIGGWVALSVHGFWWGWLLAFPGGLLTGEGVNG